LLISTKVQNGKMMNNLEKMENIVNLSKKLSWDGWDVVHLSEDASGYMDKNGLFVNGKWHIKQVFKLERTGWNIPSKFLKEINV